MVEFYPVHRAPFLSLHITDSTVPYVRSRAAAFALALAVFVGGCATPGPGPDLGPAPPTPSNVEPPPPNINLSGFPLPYRQGYADGCASAGGSERKDRTRFAADGNYRTGWQDGLAICRKK
jgi:hypothetical protein